VTIKVTPSHQLFSSVQREANFFSSSALDIEYVLPLSTAVPSSSDSDIANVAAEIGSHVMHAQSINILSKAHIIFFILILFIFSESAYIRRVEAQISKIFLSVGKNAY
jgi:hypothetical protein